MLPDVKSETIRQLRLGTDDAGEGCFVFCKGLRDGETKDSPRRRGDAEKKPNPKVLKHRGTEAAEENRHNAFAQKDSARARV